MTTQTEHLYIVRDPSILGGEPVVKGTRTPVRAVVELRRLGTLPEAIPTKLPHLTLAQVYDALGYFADHPEEIERHISANQVPDELIHPGAKRT